MPALARSRSRSRRRSAWLIVSIAGALGLACGGQTLGDEANGSANGAGGAARDDVSIVPPAAPATPMLTCSGPAPVSSSCGVSVCVNGLWQSPTFNCTPGWVPIDHPPPALPAPTVDAGTELDASADDAGSDASAPPDAAP